MKICNLHGCQGVQQAKGLCSSHYGQMRRGTLGRASDAPRYRHRPSTRPIEWPFEFMKDHGSWYRRPTGSQDPWVEVVYGG